MMARRKEQFMKQQFATVGDSNKFTRRMKALENKAYSHFSREVRK